jgi:transcriptional regulator with XRE-family HTH domain
MTRILKARLEAELTQAEVAQVVGRSQMWLSYAERGKFGNLDSGTEARVLLAIERLVAHRERMKADRQRTIQDLRLPRCTAV